MQEVAMGRVLRLAAFVSALALVSSPARADKVALTGGVLFPSDFSMSGSMIGGLVDVEGDRGFTFVGSMLGGIGAPVGDPLPPGTTVTLRGVTNDIRATATLDGITYTDVGGLESSVVADISFVTTAMLPAVLDAPATITAPFAMELLLFGVDESGGPITFSGTGTARISLGEDKGFGVPSWLLTDIDLNLSSPAPVPEPATLLLLGGGLAGVTLTRLRRKRR
jgi:hypothetical protein